jgi:apolipoprotein N-acyltransferase
MKWRNFRPFRNDHTLQFLEDFLGAGSSAFILSVAHIYPVYWFVSLFALLPFFWRLFRANLYRSVVLGIILAGCYAFVAFFVEALVSPWTFLLKFLILCLVFSAFGIAINRTKRYLGFNAFLIPFLWLPLEYILTHYAHLGSIFTFSETDSTLLIRIGSLFGILMISFVIVLINSLILILLKRVSQALSSRAKSPAKGDKRIYLPFKEIILQKRWYYFPDPRAPPPPSIVPA